MGCGRMARVHPVELPVPCCPNDQHHVPRRGDGGHHSPPSTPARPRGERTKKRRLWWSGRTGRRSSGESGRGGRGPQRGDRDDLNSLLELLLDKVVTDLQEGGEGLLTSDPRPEVSIAVTNPTEDIEDQDTVLHGLAKVAERVCHALHLAAELADGEVSLDERPEARIEAQSPGLGVAQKLALERQAGPASVRSVANEVVEVQGDRTQNPGEDDAVKAQP